MAFDFLIDTDKGETPESVARKRKVAEALIGNALGRAPRNVGEGLNAIGQAFIARQMMNEGREAEQAGRESASGAWGPLMAALGGGGAATASPSPSVPDMGTDVPTDPASERVSQAFAAQGATGADWLKYANQNATRNQPLDGKLVDALKFLPELGVSMEVFSGGQPSEGPNRVGSHRHDNGGAADVFFMKDGRRLDWANPQDVPIFQQIVERAKANGVTGFGAGDGYMQPGSMHIGFGTPAVWGAGGKGVNAPDWLRSAFGAEAPAQAGPGMPSPTGNQVAGGGTQAVAQAMQSAQPNVMQAAMGVINNPWSSDAQRSVAAALIKQSMTANQPQDLINAGKGRLYDPNTKQWLTAPDMATDAPTVQTFYDPATGQEYKAQWDGKTNQWQKIGGEKAPSGMSLRTNPDGTVEFVQGGAAGQKLTEGQSKDLVFWTRGSDANSQLGSLQGQLTNFAQSNTALLPLGIGNYLRTPEFRQAKQAADSFLAAILRKDTGAAITPKEFELYGPMFLPVPGDDPQTIQQKERARGVALLGIKSGLGTADAIAEANRLALGLPENQLPGSRATTGKSERDYLDNQYRNGGATTGEGIGSDWREIAPGVRIRKVD